MLNNNMDPVAAGQTESYSAEAVEVSPSHHKDAAHVIPETNFHRLNMLLSGQLALSKQSVSSEQSVSAERFYHQLPISNERTSSSFEDKGTRDYEVYAADHNQEPSDASREGLFQGNAADIVDQPDINHISEPDAIGSNEPESSIPPSKLAVTKAEPFLFTVCSGDTISDRRHRNMPVLQLELEDVPM
ncbi:hypothetical protein BC835DRAFT_1413533 [Cytidiella melzeri]|nr:hypothetical protein BC835DRAFT_1413533 [Cytidiella melzeri]